jgi:hypothetical protein
MSTTGKTSSYIRKTSVKESLVPNVGFKKTRFLHEASMGDTLIQLSSLVTPSDAVGYSAPNISELTSTNLLAWKSNLTLTSSLRGPLMQNLAYVVNGSSVIKLLFEAEEGEVFEGVIDHNVRTGLTMVDAKPLVASGVLLAGQTDFNVGEAFQVGMYPAAKRGVVQVVIDGQVMDRTDGNAPFGPGVSGDYYEVHTGNGLGQIIRVVADLTNDRNITVTSIGALVEKPNDSVMQAIETVQGQIDAMVPTLAALAGEPETNYQSAPNNQDLKTFGDRVLQAEADINSAESRITALESTPDVIVVYKDASGALGPVNSFINFATVVRDTHAAWSGTTFTTPANKTGTYEFTINLDINGSMIAGSLVIVTPYINGVAYLPQVMTAGGAQGNMYPMMVWKGVALSETDTVKFDIATTTIGSPVYGGGADLNVVTITRTGG